MEIDGAFRCGHITAPALDRATQHWTKLKSALLALPQRACATNIFIGLRLKPTWGVMQSASVVAERKLKRKPRHSGERRLACDGMASQIPLMAMVNGTRNRGRKEKLRLFLLVLGLALILLAPFVGIFPGPGGVILLAAGLALALKNSNWAKRLYVRFKQRWPKYGHWADWSLRRKSHFRRLARKEQADQAND